MLKDCDITTTLSCFTVSFGSMLLWAANVVRNTVGLIFIPLKKKKGKSGYRKVTGDAQTL